MEHLSLEIFDRDDKEGSKFANLQPNASITITDTSEIFASGDVWSHSFTLNVHANAHLFGTSGEIHGSRLHEQINKRRARLWVMGVPLYLGYLKLGDEVDVDENGDVDVSFESGQKTFEQLIEGAKANQVPMMSDVRIGLALWRKRWVNVRLKLSATAKFSSASRPYDIDTHGIRLDEKEKSAKPSEVTHKVSAAEIGSDQPEKIPFTTDGEDDTLSLQEYPRMVFPKGEFDGETIDCLNTDSPYDDAHPYCNIALCYQRYGYEKLMEDGSLIPYYSSEPEAQRGYETMPANRVNSAPNFFVIYWFRALMKHLGIYVEENQMMDVEDLRRLFFVNTNCAYVEPKYLRDSRRDSRFGMYRFKSASRLVPEYFGEYVDNEYNGQKKIINPEECRFTCTDFSVGEPHTNNDFDLGFFSPQLPKVEKITVNVTEVCGTSDAIHNQYVDRNSYLINAFAKSDCFPDVDISEVIQAIENGFGVRLLFDGSYKRVRIVLLRNVFRNSDVQDIACEIVSDSKVENSIRGFRMTYGNSEDTHFYYKGFADKLPHKKILWPDTSDKHDYSRWNLDAKYADLIRRITAFDKTCYVTKDSGNAYGIKVDKDAKRYKDLHPSLFELAGFMDAEDGDCTGEDETIKEIKVGFTPAIVNDVNFENERDGDGSQKPSFALFVDEKMRPRRVNLDDGTDYNDSDAVYDVNGKLYAKKDNTYVYQSKMSEDGIVKPGEFSIASDMIARREGLTMEARIYWSTGFGSANKIPIVYPITFNIDGYISEGYRLYLQDNYEPNDDGVSPIEKHNWGLTLGILRGSGSDAHVEYKADPDDREGNDTWDIAPGTSVTAHPDTCDSYGREWDYNGVQEGAGNTEGRVSLKLRAEKPNPYFNPAQEESESNRRYLTIDNPNLRGRGLADQFYKEYSYWIRNARIVKRTVRMELAQLLTIDKTKRVTVGDVTGFIRKMQFSVDNQSGLGNVTMEIMYI